MTDRKRILELMRYHPDGVTFAALAREFLYHRAAARIHELRKQGFEIKTIRGSKTMESRYQLIHDPEGLAPRWMDFDRKGQGFIVMDYLKA